ncbi:MAG TPA: iron ABC transporter permease [Labilithrix sp.]
MRRNPAVVLVVSLAVLVAAIALGVSVGTDPVSLGRALSDATSRDHDVVFAVRLPRVLLGAVAGAGLGIVGASLQALLRNPLAEPFVLGVSGGSALGATLAILVGFSGATWLGASLVPLAAFVGGVAATALVHVFASASREARATSFLLAGVIVNAIASAAITFLKTLVTPAKAQELLNWLMGFLEIPDIRGLAVLSVYVAIGVGLLLYDAARLNVLALGDDAAEHLGVRVRGVELRALLASSLVVGAITSVTGLIAFVGLVAPHIVRRLFGADTRIVMPASLGFGGALLVVCDLVSRASFRWVHIEPPVGAVTALVGGPLFLVLLLRTSRRA